MRREWTVLGFRDHSFQTIPLVIPSIYEHVLYKGVMFINKDDLKIALGKLVLKDKFEFRIKRSSKTHFEASCKYMACKFQLHTVAMEEGIY